MTDEEQKLVRGLDFTPFLGRLIVEALPDDIEEFTKEQYGLNKDSKIILSEAHITKYHVPLTRGIVRIISTNSFGERFSKWFGQDIADEGKNIEVGDIVVFQPTGSFTSDPLGKYHVIADEHVVGYIKAPGKTSIKASNTEKEVTNE